MTAAEGGAGRRLAAIGFATLGRTAFGAALSVVVLVRLPAGDTVEVFQLLVLQAVFSTVLSGSAFVRGLADGANPRAGAAGLRGLVLAWAGLAALVALADAALIPREFRAAHVTGEGWKLAILVLGTLGVAAQTALQGMLVGRIGPMRAFAPAGASFLVMSLVVAVLPLASAGAALIVLVAAQLLPVAALIGVAPEARALVRRALSAGRLPASGAQTRETLIFGAINGGALMMIFGLRAWWADAAGPELAAPVFFVMRISDVYMQVAYYTAAMSGRLQRAGLHGAAPLGAGIARRLMPGTGIAVALVAVFAVLLAPMAAAAAGWRGIALFLAVQLVVDLLRLPGAALLATAARARRRARYAALALGPVALAAVAAMLATLVVPEAAMFLYQLLAGALVVVLWFTLQRRGAGR